MGQKTSLFWIGGGKQFLDGGELFFAGLPVRKTSDPLFRFDVSIITPFNYAVSMPTYQKNAIIFLAL